ncbi:plant intracellular Ras-group-related LRR protein 4-like [Trichoplusia ni]|uniref:Plant intracellular Ras-group-related LRR protein 4-like n=1 Tax=Trichoplusia ni TaxID=7111 RepID=A0A7E5W314_TRINI|nr:plant intracellular Ras-group-related LRR protein 4-like [Trichoplusia ni]
MDYNAEILPATVLHWNYRGFTELPLHQLKGEEADVTDIYLKENLLTRLPNNIGVLEHLESLYVSGNDITELPREISKLRCLKCLDISGNRLRSIPEEIGEVRSLKFLILDENELTELPLRIAELRRLRYLSVCDNRIQWLQQRPVYNYHHCELRFWRNTNLKTLPYSLWYHMFRDQQTRCLNIGCLNATDSHNTRTGSHQCKLKINQGSKDLEVNIRFPPQYNNVLNTTRFTPASLYEICRRQFYIMLNEAVKKLNPQTYSFYSEHVRENLYNEHNNNITDLQDNFQGFNIDSRGNKENSDENGNNYKSVVKEGNKKASKTYYVPADILKEYFNFLPNFVKRDLSNGPISRCENLNCKKPVFDDVFYEFCLGDIILIDKVEEVLLSATFCSKSCADFWKRGRTTIPWTLL